MTISSLTKRIIPCLDIKNGRTVSGIHFQNLRDCGDPTVLAKAYAEQGADELVFLDISASLEKRKTRGELVKRIGENIFIPFTVGGGISTIDDINECLKNGADKVSLNTIAVNNPDFITQASQKFGSQAIVLSLDVKKKTENGQEIYKVFIKGGNEETKYEALEFAQLAEKNGAGEILLNSLDRDGTENGYDLDILQKVCSAVQIPVIASSGAGSLEDLYEAFTQTTCDAVLASSIFHFGRYTIPEAKAFLQSKGIPMR